MRKGSKTFWWLILLVVGAFVLMGYNRFSNWRAPKDAGNVAGSEVPCINPALPVPPQYHIHPRLRIVAEGKEVAVPANIGLSLTCERVLHTHDASGEIHVEPNFYQEFTLGQFFGVWGKAFSREGYEVVTTVDGRPNSEFERLVLKDKQEIVVEYRRKPAAD